MDELEDLMPDEGWMKYLPQHSTVVAIENHGSGFWSQTAQVQVRLANGRGQRYFLKLSTNATMILGEYESMKALYSVSQEIVPRPLGAGPLKDQSGLYFFLCEFIDLYPGLPDPVDFCRDIANLHRKSMDMSTTGEFGFYVTTCNGTVPQDNTWSPSWEEFFIRSLKREFELEQEVQGRCPEYNELLPKLFEKVCPALLRPLETEGRTLRPCLVHGDLWDGNVALHTDPDTNVERAYIFDSSALWAHNEYELSTWRGSRHKMTRPYVEEYFKHFPQSRPEHAWDDRNLLYSLRDDLHDSILYPGTKKIREGIIASVEKLIQRYPHGYTGSAQRKDLALAGLEVDASTHSSAPLDRVECEVTSEVADHESEHQPQMQTRWTTELAADTIGFRSWHPKKFPDTKGDSDIELGESATSPPEGSVASGT